MLPTYEWKPMDWPFTTIAWWAEPRQADHSVLEDFIRKPPDWHDIR